MILKIFSGRLGVYANKLLEVVRVQNRPLFKNYVSSEDS